MKILLITGTFPQLSETFIYRQALELAKRGHAMTVATRHVGDWAPFHDWPRPTHLCQLLPEEGFARPSHWCRAGTGLLRAWLYQPRQAWRLWQLIVRHPHPGLARWRAFLRYAGFLGLRPEVIHFEFSGIAAAYPLLGELLVAPTVASCRGADINALAEQSPQQQAARKTALVRADAIHAVSGRMAAAVTALLPEVAGRVRINRPAVPIPMVEGLGGLGVGGLNPKPPEGQVPIIETQKDDTSSARNQGDTPPPPPISAFSFQLSAFPSTPQPPNRPTIRILATGRLVWKKGFDYLVAALVKLKATDVPFHATIVGDGPLMPMLRYSVWDMGLSDHVTLTGALTPTQVLAKMREVDLFVLSSHEEGISNAVLEAMASRLPIMTTDCGGMNEAVTDGVEGFVVPVRDITAMADRLERLARDPELRNTMGLAARRRVERDFSLERQAVGFEEIYQAAIQRKAEITRAESRNQRL